ncbi:MAG: hypothetical protein HQL69_18690 [Magnetococcales bacterium]|nr:hypothetical protein [Magnetococcales bacterium]
MESSETNSKKITTKPGWQTYIIALTIYFRILGRNALKDIISKGTPIWWILAFCWGVASFTLLSNYYHSQANPQYMNELWFLFSLLWAQFGVAVAFGALAKRNFRLVADKLFMAVFPPLVLHFSIFSTIM